MSQTVIGFFDNNAEAQEAVQRLQSNGIDRNCIDISSGNRETSEASLDRDRSEDRDQESGITKFFKSLFGTDDDRADRYSRVAERTDTIVTVHAQSSDEASRVADALDACGAFNVDERAAEYGYQATGTSPDSGERGDSRSTEGSLPRMVDDLKPRNRANEAGGARERSRILEGRVDDTIRLQERKLRDERNPMDQQASADDDIRWRDQGPDQAQRTEAPVWNDDALAQPVRLNQDGVAQNESFRDIQRSTERDTENRTGRNDSNFRQAGNDRTSGLDSRNSKNDPDHGLL